MGTEGNATVKVWVLIIEHRHGTEVTTHKTDTGAWAQLAAYVNDWWVDEMPNVTKPDNNDEAIDTYFGENGARDEYYSIQPTELLP